MARLSIKVVPGSSRDEVAGWLGNELKVRVASPPEGGKANKAVIELLAEALGLSAKQITIRSGLASPRKTVEVDGMAESDMMTKLRHHEVHPTPA